MHDFELANVNISVARIFGAYPGGIMQSLVLAFTDSSVTSEQRPDPYLLAAQRGIARLTLHTLKRDLDFGNYDNCTLSYQISMKR